MMWLCVQDKVYANGPFKLVKSNKTTYYVSSIVTQVNRTKTK